MFRIMTDVGNEIRNCRPDYLHFEMSNVATLKRQPILKKTGGGRLWSKARVFRLQYYVTIYYAHAFLGLLPPELRLSEYLTL